MEFGEVGTLVKHSAVLYLSLVNTGEKDNQTMAAKKTDPRVFLLKHMRQKPRMWAVGRSGSSKAGRRPPTWRDAS